MLYLLALFIVWKLAAGFPTWPDAAIRLVSQSGDDIEFDPSDLSFITKLAAIGDSYSAGIGAGNRLGSFLDALNSQGGEFPFNMHHLKTLTRLIDRHWQTGHAAGTTMRTLILLIVIPAWVIPPSAHSSSCHVLVPSAQMS